MGRWTQPLGRWSFTTVVWTPADFALDLSENLKCFKTNLIKTNLIEKILLITKSYKISSFNSFSN